MNVNLGRKKLKLLGQGRGEFKQFFNNLGKYKPKFTQGQIWWIRIGQENLNLSIAFYSPVISHLKPSPLKQLYINHLGKITVIWI